MRVGVIGRGFGSQAVGPAFEATEGCKVVDVVSPRDRDAVARLCDEVDLVAVHSPPFMHLDNVRMAVERGRAVLCDKPFGRHADDARAMRDMAVGAGVPHFLNFQLRFFETRQRIREHVADGVIGEPQHAILTLMMSLPRSLPYKWVFDADLGGGWLRAQGSHWIDLSRWLFGDIVGVSGEAENLVNERSDAEGNPRACTADDAFSLRLRTARNVSVVMDSSWAASVTLTPSVVVLGSKGALEETGHGSRLVLHTRKGGAEEIFVADANANPVLDPMKVWASMIRDAVRDGVTPPEAPTFEDGLACVEAMDQVART
jgi:predicted dehydrogenase